MEGDQYEEYTEAEAEYDDDDDDNEEDDEEDKEDEEEQEEEDAQPQMDKMRRSEFFHVSLRLHANLTHTRPKKGLAHVSFEKLAQIKSKMGMEKEDEQSTKKKISKDQILKDLEGAASQLKKKDRVKKSKAEMKRADKHR